MQIKVLGPGCRKCHQTEALVKELVAENGIDATVDYITDLAEIARHGVFATPAVIVDGKVVCSGKVPSKADVLRWIGK